jgi:hypothetical protein
MSEILNDEESLEEDNDIWKDPASEVEVVEGIIVKEKPVIKVPEYLGEDHYNKNMSANEQMIEWMKCKMSPLYWVEKYAYTPVTGGFIHMGSSEQWQSSNKFRLLFKLFELQDNVAFISSRQIGKTTLALLYALYCMVFFPGIKIAFLTLDSNRGKDAVARLKEMMSKLPNWMRVPNASKAERTTFFHLKNKSMFDTMFVSGSIDPDTLGRGLSGSIIILDEAAFIKHMDIVYSAMQPSISTAKIFAKKFGYPTCMIAVSTPNGAGGNWFYGILQRSVKFDDIYDYENKVLYDGYEVTMDDPEKNAFISMKILWSDTHRDQDWYNKQCKELNFNQRKINQELDLVFLGSSTSIFSDDVICKLVPKKSSHEMQLPFGHKLEMFSELIPGEIYLLGVDTAMSAGINSDYSALSLVHAVSGQEVGAWKGKFSVVKRFAALVKAAVQGLSKLYNVNEETLRVIIERNSIGKETVEELLYNDPLVDDFDYEAYLYQEEVKNGKGEPTGDYTFGLYTSNAGKMGNGKRDQMFNELMNQVNGRPDLFHSDMLIDELRNLEQKANGRIEAMRGQHDDVVMAYNFCLYVRKLMIKSGELQVDGEIQAFALTPETIMDFISVTIGTGGSTGQESDEWVENEDGFHFKSDKKKPDLKEYDMSNYLIGM